MIILHRIVTPALSLFDSGENGTGRGPRTLQNHPDPPSCNVFSRRPSYAAHAFRICAGALAHMRPTRSAYALELWRICGAAFRTCPRSVILGGVVTSNPSVTCLLGLYKHTINTVQQLDVSTDEHSTFCVLDMRWSSGAYAAQLFRICAPRVPHMRHTRSAYAPHAFRICAPRVPHMRWSCSAYAVEVFLGLLFRC